MIAAIAREDKRATEFPTARSSAGKIIINKREDQAVKNDLEIFFRFIKIVSGIGKRVRIGCIKMRTTHSMTTVMTAIKMKDWTKLFFIGSIFPAPQSMENKTPLPMHKPRMTEVRKTINV